MKLNLSQFDFSQKLNQRETLIFIATLLIASLGFFRACVTPNQKVIADANEQIQKLEIERSQLGGKKSQVVQFKQWIGTPTLVDQSIDSLAKPLHLRGVQVVSLELGDSSKKDEAFTKKTVLLTLSGNFISVGAYIEYLENLPLPLMIESLSVAPDGSNPSRVTSKIQGGFYGSN